MACWKMNHRNQWWIPTDRNLHEPFGDSPASHVWWNERVDHLLSRWESHNILSYTYMYIYILYNIIYIYMYTYIYIYISYLDTPNGTTSNSLGEFHPTRATRPLASCMLAGRAKPRTSWRRVRRVRPRVGGGVSSRLVGKLSHSYWKLPIYTGFHGISGELVGFPLW